MNFFLHIVALISFTLTHALGYNVLFGKGKVFHFGPIGVSICAAYVMTLLLIHTGSFTLAFFGGLFSACIISSFFAWLSQKLEPDGLGVMSIAVHLAMLSVVLNWNSLTRGALGIPRIPRLPFLDSVASFAIAGSIVAALFFLFIWKIDRSAFGRQLSALAEHEWHAKSLGVNRALVHWGAFLVTAVGATLTNFFFLQYLTILHPNDYQFPLFIFLVMIIVAGKPGSVVGVTISTVLLVILKEAIRFVPLSAAILGPTRLILFGLILFVAVWWRRDTLFPHQRKI